MHLLSCEKAMVEDVLLAVMRDYDQVVTSGSLWPNMIRDSNEDGWSAQSEETQKSNSEQLGNGYVSSLKSDSVNIQDVS